MKLLNLNSWIILFCAIFTSSLSHAQITGNGHSNTANTSYTNGATNDLIYIYCNDPQTNTQGSLTATLIRGAAPFSFN